MNTLLASGSFVGSGLAAWWLTGIVRSYATAHGLMDHPNARSSHTTPTPRGGGLACAVCVLAGTAVGTTLGVISSPIASAILVGGALVAAVGLWDDLATLRPLIRLVVHFVAAAWAVNSLGGYPSIGLGVHELPVGAVGSVIVVVVLAGAANLYNFMDGIDGIAAAQAIVAAGVAGALLTAKGRLDLAIPALLIAGAAAGFLVWNRPPARIFMGDVGSGFLGFVLATLAVASENTGAMPALVWVVLLFPFVFDTILTLARRVLHREAWYHPHRQHAYQRAVQSGLSHLRVTMGVVVIDLVLGGLAWWSVLDISRLPAAFGGTTLLLTGVYLWVERRRPMFADHTVDSSVHF